VAVLGLAPAEDDNGILIYLQELLGVDREVSVAAGLIRFRNAQVVDYLGRDAGDSLQPTGGRVMVPVRGRGVVALRLSGVELNAH
jgi:hypothetical protein